MGAVGQDVMNTPSTISASSSSRGGASTPSTVARPRNFHVHAGKQQQELQACATEDDDHRRAQRAFASVAPPPLEPSLRVVLPSPPAAASAPLLCITCSFGCISL
jgi:hypothetical protein